ncbi:MAG: N-methyl-L-tryptophan oxidase [Gemmatimonadota bacterium]
MGNEDRDRHFDVIVVGLGGMGSATLYELARRGKRVLGLESFEIPHELGSSHGVNRIIRLAYYEHPSYVPLLRRAYELWQELERRADDSLLITTGSIDTDVADGPVFNGSLESCRLHGVPHEVLTATQTNGRFPGYRLPEGHRALFQADGGFLLSEKCIVAYVQQALALGAQVRTRERVQEWEAGGEGVSVETNQGRYHASRLVITAGAWAAQMVPELAGLAVPERQVLGWFRTAHGPRFAPDAFPVFNAAFPEGRYYGFPEYGTPGLKIGRYHHLNETVQPDSVRRTISREDEEVLRVAVERYFPDANREILSTKTCMFTNSPDEHFILDLLPDRPEVAVAAGFSGHGFKFCSVVGEVLAELVTLGETRHDISLFQVERFRKR